MDLFGSLGPHGAAILRELGQRLDTLAGDSIECRTLRPHQRLISDVLAALKKKVGVVLAGFMVAWQDCAFD